MQTGREGADLSIRSSGVLFDDDDDDKDDDLSSGPPDE